MAEAIQVERTYLPDGDILQCRAGTIIGSQSIAGAGNLTAVRVYSAAGTYTWTKPASLSFAIAQAIAGGGGGGGAAGTVAGTSASAGGGGVGGNWSFRILDASLLGATETVTVGAGGAGGSIAGSDGGNGGDSSFGALITAPGGQHGYGMLAQTVTTITTRTIGAVGVGGDLNGSGQPGDVGIVIFDGAGGITVWPGKGGGSLYQGGGASIVGSLIGDDGQAGISPGAGGAGGGGRGGGIGSHGGAGADGLVLVWEYSNP